MDKITPADLLALKQGDKMVCIQGRMRPEFYKFLMIHPENENYILALNMNKDAEKIYIPRLYEHYYINYTDRDLLDVKLHRVLTELEEVKRAIRELEETGKTYDVL